MTENMLKPPPETAAVMAAAQERASDALSRYQALGADVADFVVRLAEKDADASIRALKIFLQVHRLAADFDDEVVLRSYFRDLWLAGLFVPLAKWVTSHFLAAHAGVVVSGKVLYRELPPRPGWLDESIPPLSALFPAGCKAVVKVLRTRLTETRGDGGPSRRALRLAWSFLGLKAMCPPLWADKVADSLKDHAELLSSEPPPLSLETEVCLKVAAASVARLAYQAINPGGDSVVRYDSLPRPKLSQSAGWVKLYDQEARRWTTMRGTRAAQYQRLGGLGGSLHEELHSMDYRPRAGVREFRQFPYQFNWSDWDFQERVSVVALQEPFKIRTISIADGPATAAASPFQKSWHGALRRLPPFQLIGGARVADAVLERRDKWGLPLFVFDGTPFVSGDYSAATDRLSMRATKVVLTELLKTVALPSELRRRIEDSLTGSLLDYSRTLETFRGKVPDALLDSISVPVDTRQTNGQLMGNVLSFPILCIINFAGWLATQWESLKRGIIMNDSFLAQTLERALVRGYLDEEDFAACPVLINGDDILFQATPEEYGIWREIITELGFKLSTGKNYYSADFFTINSELYTREGFTSRPWWGSFETDAVRLRQEVKWETGLDVLSADMRRILPKMQEFLRATCDPLSWPTLNRLWLTHQVSHGLLEPWKGLNWFLPLELGGIGMDPTGWGTYDVTYAQKKLAIRSLLDPLGSNRFFPGLEGSLVSAKQRKDILALDNYVTMTGEIVVYNRGLYVLDKNQPIALRRTRGGRYRVNYRLHPTSDTAVMGSRHVDPWLDHHVSGVRLEAARVAKGVSQALEWGLRLSDKHLSLFEDLDVRPRYRCALRVVHAPATLITQQRDV